MQVYEKKKTLKEFKSSYLDDILLQDYICYIKRDDTI